MFYHLLPVYKNNVDCLSVIKQYNSYIYANILLVVSNHLITLMSKINGFNEVESLEKEQDTYDTFLFFQ